MTTFLRRSLIPVLLAVLSLPLAAPAATAATKKQTKIDTARANAAQIRKELQAVTSRIQAQEAKSASAHQAAAAAQQRLRSARAEAAAVGARLETIRKSARSIAIREYMQSGLSASRIAVGSDPATVARAAYLRDVALGQTSDIRDALAAAREDSELARERAEAAASSASGRDRTAADTLGALKQSRQRQLQLAAAAEARLEAAVKEADALRRIGSRGSRGVSRRGAVSLTTVRGITVATEIANQLERMLVAAEADGRVFGGGGYRSSEGQVAARRKNCGSSQYDIYDKPASKCRPPTARPGQSMHEQGLAIDFTYNGSLIQSRSSDGFQWLKANGARFGFYNLPSEAWHWSTNGN